ncbi:cytochrome P450 [Dissoconium aciculare CBS 342.82]|uniref:Cytochrome P450 n=1 Tax=Dissoconium aciculare CBS 342.82 TaxID=1314786 RepID=A0A6J3LRA8_9PEZI|nr:cytochrome P450 [Dissoconium aciculare CBS 342.82]KAF1818370.1 cytochrome P450 [Dissoconium aciculare CBS 342.82]
MSGLLNNILQHVQDDIGQNGSSKYWAVLALGITGWVMFRIFSTGVVIQPSRGSNFPPIVQLTRHEQFKDPINSYSRAMREHGDIIAVKKKDKMEIVVSEKYVQKVLTDETNFSFEQGVADAMNFEFLMELTEGKIFKIMADVTDQLLSKRMDTIVQQVSNVFFSRASELAQSAGKGPVDIFEHCQSTVADAMVLLILGKGFLTRANGDAVKLAANDVAELGGIYQNRSYFARTFPWLWRPITWFKVVVLRFMFGLMITLGRPIWAEMTRLVESPATYDATVDEDVTLLALLVRKFASEDRKLSLGDRGKIYLVLISTMFASVHQVASTMVWVFLELALRPEYQEEIYEEIKRQMPNGPEQLTHEALKQSARVDSFIRETMRTKGDTFSTVRMAINNVQLGQYIIPKGYTVHPNAYLAHNAPSEAGENPTDFDGRRWLGKNKPAAMSGPGNLAWGMGRWACLGRYFAVAEIKMMVFSLLSTMRVEIVDNKYEIADLLMIASAPPIASFKLRTL